MYIQSIRRKKERGMLGYYWKRISVFFWTYLLAGAGLSVLFIFTEFMNLDTSFWALCKTLGSSVLFLSMEFCFLILPFLFYLWILPAKYHGSRADKWFSCGFYAAYLFAFLFIGVSEYFFWDEFSSRFNFIAVDYLVYTQEVIKNIWQSYPIVKILGTAFVLSAATAAVLQKRVAAPAGGAPSGPRRALALGAAGILCAGIAALSSPSWAQVSANRYNNEIASGGVYSFAYAFFHNELDYDTFYITEPEAQAASDLKTKLKQEEDSRFQKDGIARRVVSGRPEIRANVVFVLMESMGRIFMKDDPNPDYPFVTPNLARLSEEGIYFPHTYSTGTRTVRGIEASVLSVPPLPGMSIVRRKDNENLRNIGDVFRERGYETDFLYGGFGYFDNMNYFFANNGFNVIDRSDMSKKEITFANAWGVSDEDLFNRALKEADRAHAAQKPFFQYILTASNHRPYTYPEGRVEIPSGTGRSGAVQYADYAVGRFVEEASKKPWFDNTVFVFLADHGPGSSGRQELAPREHRIPFIVYAPKLFKAKRYEQVISQIDVPPTLLALLNFSYDSYFYGSDATGRHYKSRYFVNNYQKIGYVQDDVMTVLKPVKAVDFYKGDELTPQPDKDAFNPYLKEALAYYQSAKNWKTLLKK